MKQFSFIGILINIKNKGFFSGLSSRKKGLNEIGISGKLWSDTLHWNDTNTWSE